MVLLWIMAQKSSVFFGKRRRIGQLADDKRLLTVQRHLPTAASIADSWVNPPLPSEGAISGRRT
jgi:hypothetical protein